LLSGWRARLIACVAVAVLCVWFHKTILSSLAQTLIIDEAGEEDDNLAILGCDTCYYVAAEAFNRGLFRRVLVFEDSGRNLVKLGIIEPRHASARRQLTRHGVPGEAIVVVDVKGNTAWHAVDSLGNWMKQDQTARVQVLTSQFGSRCLRDMFDRALDEPLAERVHVVGLPDRRFDETNWWRSRVGVKTVMNSLLALGRVRCIGRPTSDLEHWDPIEYENQLRRQLLGRR